MKEKEFDEEDEILTEEARERIKAEQRRAEALRGVMKDMGVRRDPLPQIDREKAMDPLGALEDMSNPTILEIPEEDLEEEPEEKPLRRTGSGTAVEYASRKDVHDDPWSRNVPGLGTVRVTREQQETYEDVFLSDAPLVLPINMLVGTRRKLPVTVVCRTITTYEREVAAMAIKKVVEKHPMIAALPRGVVDEYLLRAEMLMMVQSVGDEKWPALEFKQNGRTPAHQDPGCEKLAELLHTHFSSKQNRWFQLVAKALHIFATVCDILDDAEVNGDFTDPVGSD